MEYRNLGRTGVQVSPLCLGAMMFGAWGNPDHDESIRVIHRALDAGINFVDTADVYARGESEEIVGKALKGRRDDVVLATTVHGSMGDDPNERGNARRWIAHECDASLRRLGTDWIDLYQIHRWDPGTDHDETLGALTDLVRAGKIRYLGSSTYPPSEIVAAQWVAEKRGRERFVCEQPPYSLLVRGVEAEVLPVCVDYGLGVIPWGPLAGGWLSGRWRKGQEPPTSMRSDRIPQRYDLSLPENQRKLDAAEALAQLAEQAGMSLIHMALAFVIRHPAVTAAIIGPRTMEHLESQLGAADVHSTTLCSTKSTRSSRRGRTSASRTRGGRLPHSRTRRCAVASRGVLGQRRLAPRHRRRVHDRRRRLAIGEKTIEEPAELVDRAQMDDEEEAVLSDDAIALDDLRDLRGERRDLRQAAGARLDPDDRRQGVPEQTRVEYRVVAGDDTGALEPLHAFGHGRRREADPPAELRERDPAVLDQLAEDLSVGLVQARKITCQRASKSFLQRLLEA
jgi:aryl-alcohol dehydrogenase-like predicted oxidoreductase